MLLIAPVAMILVAENLGHIKAVSAMTGRNLDRYMGRAFVGDGVATMVSGAAAAPASPPMPRTSASWPPPRSIPRRCSWWPR
jgi:xanthine/uracil permease